MPDSHPLSDQGASVGIGVIPELVSERDHLRAENEALKAAHDPLTCELCHAEGVTAELAGLRAENERLREAPTRILERLVEASNIVEPDAISNTRRTLQRMALILGLEFGLAHASDEERRAHDALHGCWECGTSDMRGNVCAEHEPLRAASPRTEQQDKETR